MTKIKADGELVTKGREGADAQGLFCVEMTSVM